MPTSKFSPFQLVIMAFFLVCLLGGVAVFTIFGGKSRNEDVGTVVIWGTMKESTFDTILIEMAGGDTAFQNVTYVEKNPKTYLANLVEAIASGKSPDLVMLPDSQVVSFAGKIVPIPYSTFSQRNFNDAFLDEGSIFLSGSGVLGMPILIDPLVMYYNRDLFATAGIATYPKTWTELQAIAPKMTSLDAGSNVKRSAVAMGSYDNVNHAKEILSALFMQVGEQIVSFGADGRLTSSFGNAKGEGAVETPAQSALRFYTNFSNPSQSIYSWNRALPNSLDAFVAGDLGIYFGRASENSIISSRNQNLAFAVAPLPQTAGAKVRITYGSMTALSIPRGSQNVAGAIIIARKLSEPKASQLFATVSGLPPVRRDLLADVPDDSALSVFAGAALISRTWPDPNPQATDAIFKRMIESTVSGREVLEGAIRTASAELSSLFDQTNNAQ